MDARQVAVLVPTTVLAQQHYRTFRERMGAYPVRIEMLSRFRTGAQRRGIAEGLRDGKVDIVIGTHALLQEGLAFHNLGLVIIDEEQRFGVAHKERLKAMRHMVDVLTMTATPIPRTLYLSLTGARQISLLQTPPRERMAIETLVARKTDEVVRGAILREINRDGQVFYLHNRVMTIDRVGARLRRLVPEASIEIAHGQMATAELASVMRRFVAGDFAVLLCTTIIESGMDIPRANTILIDRADRFGMADLYQLRGRVGRSNRKAYAYFLLPEKGPIDGAARQRLAAITRHAGLGAGFHLAMRDLEIRGGGNLLGAEQSGHIAAVGFGLYCQLLRRSIARLKGETMPPLVNVVLALDFLGLSPRAADETAAAATLPYTFIEDEPLRVDTYRRLAEAATEADVHKLKAELTDRFGPLPPPARRLLTTARIRVAAAAQGLSKVETRGDKIMLHDGRDYVSRAGRFPRLRGRTADRKLMEILRCVRSFKTWAP
jgi:transcription-repair coupling factor (superfamily II helicase)